MEEGPKGKAVAVNLPCLSAKVYETLFQRLLSLGFTGPGLWELSGGMVLSRAWRDLFLSNQSHAQGRDMTGKR